MTAAQEKRWQAEYEIIKKIGKVPSCREMQKLLEEQYGIRANHNIINGDLKKDLETLTKKEYENHKSGILDMLDTELNIAHNISTNNPDDALKLKAMNTVSKLSKVKADIMIRFRQAQSQQAKKEQAEINVFIGQPKQADLSKLKKIEGDSDEGDKEKDNEASE
jgi:hypothetical protein